MIAGLFSRALLTLFAIVVLVPHDDPSPKAADPAAKAELERLQGVWVVVALTVAGNELTEDKYRGSVIVIEGTDQKLLFNDKPRGTYTITLRPDAKPSELDLTIKAGPRKGNLIPAIYKLEGDSLTICTDTELRPKTFTAAAGRQSSLAVYKKQKPKKTEP